MTKDELNKIKNELLLGSGLPHYSHNIAVSKALVDQLVRGVESLQQQLEAAHAFHDVAVKQRDAREWMLRDAERKRDEMRAEVERERDEALQKERERCARICDLEFAANWHASAMAAANAAKRCAELIRATDKKP